MPDQNEPKPVDWQRLEELFHAALDRTEHERANFVESACGNDPPMRAALLELLAGHARVNSRFINPVASPTHPDQPPEPRCASGETDLVNAAAAAAALVTGTTPPTLTERPGTVIGRYKLLQEVGHGGFGTVFMAEQREPVVRKVALKVIKLGMDTRQVIARFEAERQALAMMDHPNIARVLDAGATDSGRPYFVMELVRGDPLTRFCDENCLSLRQRLELFSAVCHAVQHAHTKGLIHRDLKPSNVLVTMHDDKPVAKVIDFGIAKATHDRLTDKTLFTELRQFIGTPAYMSPEQAQLSGLDIDTRSDIYALGVLLYELLTGTTPFDSHKLLSAGYDEMRRIIREDEPPKPSTRISALSSATFSRDPPRRGALPSSGEQRGPQFTRRGGASRLNLADATPLVGSSSLDIAHQRHTDPGALCRSLRGDLDWIVMKCLEKDRTRRYPAASELAADIQRYLRDEPIVARPPSALYQLRKLTARHKALVAGMMTVLLVLIAGIMTTSWQAVTARRQRQIAERQRQIAEQQRDRANTEAVKAEEVARFLQDMLASVDPEVAGTRDTTLMREILEKAVKRVATELTGQPAVEGAVLTTIGNTYRSIGRYNDAEPHLVQALEIRGRVLGADHPDTIDSMLALATLYHAQCRLADLEALAETMVEVSSRVLGEQHVQTRCAMASLGEAYRFEGRYREAEPLLLGALQALRRDPGPADRRTLAAMVNLALLYQNQGRYPEAEPLFLEALEGMRRALGPDDPHTLIGMVNLGMLYRDQSRYAEAQPLVAEALELQARVLGETHSHTLATMADLAQLHAERGEFEAAEPLYRRALEGQRRQMGDQHPLAISVLIGIANSLRLSARYREAEPLYREALEAQRRMLGDEHPNTLSTTFDLAGVLADLTRYDEAVALYEQTLDPARRVLGDEHPHVLRHMSRLADIYAQRGDYARAEPLQVKALELLRRSFGEEHVDTLASLNALALMYSGQQRYHEAESLLAKALPLYRRLLGDGHRFTLNCMSNLAMVYQYLERLDEAEALTTEALAATRRALGEDNPETYTSMNNLAMLYTRRGRFGEAEPLMLAAYEGQRRALGDKNGDTIQFLTNLALLYFDLSKYSDAEPLLRRLLAARRSALPQGHPSIAAALGQLGYALLKTGDDAEAEPLLRECLAIREQVLPPDHWLLAQTTSLLGGALAGQAANVVNTDPAAAAAKLAEAEPLLIEGYSGLLRGAEQIPARARAQRTREAVQRLLELYDTWVSAAPNDGYGGKALEWRAKLAALPPAESQP
ncbi:MAG TPA: tetratricopeptide repeat protein [Phycisphaerae bacterium]